MPAPDLCSELYLRFLRVICKNPAACPAGFPAAIRAEKKSRRTCLCGGPGFLTCPVSSCPSGFSWFSGLWTI